MKINIKTCSNFPGGGIQQELRCLDRYIISYLKHVIYEALYGLKELMSILFQIY